MMLNRWLLVGACQGVAGAIFPKVGLQNLVAVFFAHFVQQRGGRLRK